MLILIVVFDGEFSSNGFFGFVWVVYLMYAAIHFMFFPSRALKSVEQGSEATFGRIRPAKYIFRADFAAIVLRKTNLWNQVTLPCNN